MKADTPTVAARRARLKAWIDTHFAGVNARFIEATGTNQGELSGLLNSKSFGEKRAESLEKAANMPPGYLVAPLADTSSAIPSHVAGLDLAKLEYASDFLEQLFRSKDKVFIASKNARLLAEVYDELCRPAPSTVVELAVKFGKQLDGGMDERQGKTGSTQQDDQRAPRKRARPA